MSKIAKSMAVLGVVAGLGVAALPLSTYAQTSGPVTIQAEVNSSIAVTAADELIDLGTISSSTPVHEKSTKVTVSTTEEAYTLNIQDSDAYTAMVLLDEDGKPVSAAVTAGKDFEIPASANVVKGTAAWGYKVADKAYAAVTTKPVKIADATTSPLESGSAATEVTFGVTANANLDNGIYQGGVVFTATAN